MDETVARKVVEVVVEAATNKASFTEAQATARGYLTGLGGITGAGTGATAVGGLTSDQLLFQKQMERERALEQLLAAQGITASPGVGKLSARELQSLGLSAEQLAGIGIGRMPTGETRPGEQMGWGTRSALQQFPGMSGLGQVMGFGAGTLALGGAGIALTAGVEAGKSLIDTFREEEHAAKDLRNAYDDMNVPFSKYSGQIDAFIAKNRSYISDQGEVKEGYAALTRAGIDQVNVQKAIDDALDISGNTGKTFSESLNLILLGLEGNTRGLKALGINVKDYGDLTNSTSNRQHELAAAQKEVATATEAHDNAVRALQEDQQRLHDKSTVSATDLMVLKDKQDKVTDTAQNLAAAQANLKQKTDDVNNVVQHQADLLGTVHDRNKDGRQNTDDLTQANDRLHDSWVRLSEKAGPPLMDRLSKVEDEASKIVDDLSGKGGGGKALADLFGDLGNAVNNLPGPVHAAVVAFDPFLAVLGEVKAFIDWINKNPVNPQVGPTYGKWVPGPRGSTYQQVLMTPGQAAAPSSRAIRQTG